MAQRLLCVLGPRSRRQRSWKVSVLQWGWTLYPPPHPQKCFANICAWSSRSRGLSRGDGMEAELGCHLGNSVAARKYAAVKKIGEKGEEESCNLLMTLTSHLFLPSHVHEPQVQLFRFIFMGGLATNLSLICLLCYQEGYEGARLGNCCCFL